ncbi:sodium:solute symporter [Legionella israelensis]|uniref:sodium:solute symporter family protein n=1 Tax=Legionella israelensis TaxID=454 RepID=UPI00117C6A21|nr:sodium:solute symporter [Legionella israelensis]QDP72103.1 sodium:solute symporter [Legionella israelensis]
MEIFSIISGLFLLTIVLGSGLLKSGKITTENQYLLANRKTKLFALTATLVMTEFNTSTLIAFSSAGYYAGFWALTLPFVFLFGLLFYAFTVAKKWKGFNGISVAYYFSERYGHDIGRLVASILFVSMLGFSATYIRSCTIIFSPLFPHLNRWSLSALITAAILLMTWRGGLVAIIRTDIISFCIIMIFFPLLLLYVYQLPSHSTIKPSTLFEMQQALPPKFIVSLVFLTMFSYILAPWYGQKIISAESPRVAYQAIILAAFLVFAFYFMGVTAVSLLKVKGVALADPQNAFPYIINHLIPSGLQRIGYVVLFLIGATTLSGVWSAMVTLLIGGSDPALSKLQRTLMLTMVCAFLSYAIANLFVDQILNKMILANIPVVALSFSLLAGFYWQKTNRYGVYTSVITGLAWGVGCYCKYGDEGLYTWYWAMYGLPLIFLSGIFATLLFNKRAVKNKGLLTVHIH